MAAPISLPMLQNRPLGSWNEVNSMPTHRQHFSVIGGLIWLKWQTGECCGTREVSNCPLCLCWGYLRKNILTIIPVCCLFAPSALTHTELTLITSFEQLNATTRIWSQHILKDIACVNDSEICIYRLIGGLQNATCCFPTTVK